jgi:hypothetical protein
MNVLYTMEWLSLLKWWPDRGIDKIEIFSIIHIRQFQFLSQGFFQISELTNIGEKKCQKAEKQNQLKNI